ncbi:MAG: hypothetical protein PCFJNLEI_02058 [Verrucomicrobiae bacterium]|nr:hypothetical protein [Verrucomicrobiae bacterium]
MKKARELLERYGGRSIALNIQPGIGAEGFRIDDNGITGNDERGLIYGVGKHLRDPSWRGTSVPEKPLRLIYFASHFHNFYHDAPVDEVCRYVEELALWGCNGLAVWFDMHHFHGMQDPAAQAMVTRLRAILTTAESVGMSATLLGLANEGFANSRAELRADFHWKENGYRRDIGAYGVELCPNKPGGLELICESRQQMLDAFRGLNVGCFTLWPYDQGGCTCAACKPWGANGYLRAAEAVAKLVRQNYPAAKTGLSAWYFDKHIDGEWAGLGRAFANGAPAWVDYLLADNPHAFPKYPLEHGTPGGLPMISFPEISMVNMWPWGAFGANPRPTRWQNYWNELGDKLAGILPYSEGIYEDLNKVCLLQLAWDSRRSTRDILREYAAAEFSPAVADEMVELIFALETAMTDAKDHLSIDHKTIHDVLYGGGWDGFPDQLPRIYVIPANPAAASTVERLRRVDAQLPAEKRTAWRWRVVFLRALLGDELQCSAGRPTDKADEYFEELNRIYHAENAEWLVAPVSRRALTQRLSVFRKSN